MLRRIEQEWKWDLGVEVLCRKVKYFRCLLGLVEGELVRQCTAHDWEKSK